MRCFSSPTEIKPNFVPYSSPVKHEQGKKPCTDNVKYEDLYLNFYIDEEIVLNIEEYKAQKMVTCNLCFEANVRDIRTHLERHGSDSSATTCVFCNRRFDYKLQFNMHQCEYVEYEMPIMRKPDDSEQYYYLCQMCTSTYDNVADPDQCNERFAKYELYKDHLKAKHLCDIECLLCTNTYDNANAYVQHLKHEHLLAGLSCKCEKC